MLRLVVSSAGVTSAQATPKNARHSKASLQLQRMMLSIFSM